MAGGIAPLMHADGIRSGKPGSNASITPAERAMSGGRIRSDTSNGMAANGWINQPPRSRRTRIGNMEASMNPILSIMMASGRCGTSPDQTRKITSCKVTLRAGRRSGWSKHQVFFGPGRKSLRLLRVQAEDGYEAVFSRVMLGKQLPAAPAGLWWCEAKRHRPDFPTGASLYRS